MVLSVIQTSFTYIIKHKLIFLLIIVASILTLMPFVFDGQYGCVHNECGFIVGSNYRDGIWYQAVAATAFKTFPFRMPNFAGEPLQGYHYIPNLISYLLSFIGIPIAVSFYKLFPILYMVGIIIVGIVFARKIKDNSTFVTIFLFFLFFGMPLTFIRTLHPPHVISNYLLINTFQATRILESIHFAFSFLLLFGALIMICRKKLTLRHHILLGFFVFLTFGIKFYTATLLLLILVTHETLHLFSHKKIVPFILHNAMYGIGALIAIIIFYNPFSGNQNGSTFVFSPFATAHHLIETKDLFYNHNLVLARYYIYERAGLASPRLLAIELFSSFLFVIFYFGSRVLGFLYIFKQIITKKITKFELSLTVAIIISIVLSQLFIQKGDWFNPMQFAVVGAFLMNVFAATFVYEWFQKNKYIGWILFTLIFFITFPLNLVNLGYLNSPARLVIDQKEMDALNFLKKQPDGTILAPILENDMAYVSAFTGKQTYVNFTNVLGNNGIAYEKRLEQIQHLDKVDVDSLEVQYMYIPLIKDKEFKSSAVWIDKCRTSEKFQEIFRNKKVVVCSRN
jgi:hypothetical protein